MVRRLLHVESFVLSVDQVDAQLFQGTKNILERDQNVPQENTHFRSVMVFESTS